MHRHFINLLNIKHLNLLLFTFGITLSANNKMYFNFKTKNYYYNNTFFKYILLCNVNVKYFFSMSLQLEEF